MVWTTRKLDRDRDYVVVKHALRGVNYNIKGVKFRDGFAVVEKNSKLYYELKKMKPCAVVKEYPLDFIMELPFITRSKDIEMVFGKDIYHHYVTKLLAVKKQKSLEEHKLSDKCQHLIKEDQYCKNLAFEYSPSKYCQMHILSDPRLSEFGIEIPEKIFGREYKKELTQKVLEHLEEISTSASEVKVESTEETSAIEEMSDGESYNQIV